MIAPDSWCRSLATRPARTLGWERAWSIALRTAHLMAMGLVVGGLFWGVERPRLLPAIVMTVLTGLGLASLELYKSLHWLFLGKGVAVLLKLLLLACLPFAGNRVMPIVILVLIIASVGAHMPSRFRHYSMLLRGVVPATPKESRPATQAVEERRRPVYARSEAPPAMRT